MADPLSIAASITGLIALTGSISSIMLKFVSGVSDVPDSARAALSTIEEMRLALVSVKHVMNRLQSQPKHRRQMVYIRHLAIVFRESVISVSKLEAILKSTVQGDRVVDRLKWLKQEDTITRCLTQIEAHKSSFSFILNVLQAESEIEARDSLDSLQAVVQQLVEQNQEILVRLEKYECEVASMKFFEDDQSTIRPVAAPAFMNQPSARLKPLDTSDLASSITFRDFNETLEASRVYRRVQMYNSCDASFTSSNIRSHAWSMMSDLSLSDISNMSVIALPLTLEEINEIGSELAFASIFNEQLGNVELVPPLKSPLRNRIRSAQPRLQPVFKLPKQWLAAKKMPTIAQDYEDENEVKVILLGAANSGKSTYLKQMSLLATAGFSDNDRDQYRIIIFGNIRGSFSLLSEAMEVYGIDFDLPENKMHADYLELNLERDLGRGEYFPRDFLPRFKALKEDKGFQAAMTRGNEFDLNNTLFNYNLNNLERFFEANYVPTERDILYARLKTTGIRERVFHYGLLTYRMYDPGGTRSDRKSWIHTFEGVDALIFFAPIGDYNEVLVEDKDANCVLESLMLFESLCNSQWFTNTTIILLLNKTDALKEKLPRYPLSSYFPDYEGGDNDFDAACKYFLKKFTKLNRSETKSVHAHFTRTVDTVDMRSVAGKVHDLMIQRKGRVSVLP